MSFWAGIAIGGTVGTVLGMQVAVYMAIRFLSGSESDNEVRGQAGDAP